MRIVKKIFNKFAKIVYLVFNPISPIVIFGMGLLVNVPDQVSQNVSANNVESANNGFNITEFLYSDSGWSKVNIIILVWFVSAFIITYNKNRKDELLKKINDYEKEVNKLERLMERDAGILLSKYDSLSEYRYTEILSEILRRFTTNNEAVMATQIYKYSTKFCKDNVKIKVKYVTGYIEESIDSNALIQIYYNMDNKRYKKAMSIIEKYKDIVEHKIETEKDIKETHEMKQLLMQEILKEMKSIKSRLNKKRIKYYKQYKKAMEDRGIEYDETSEVEDNKMYLDLSKKYKESDAILYGVYKLYVNILIDMEGLGYGILEKELNYFGEEDQLLDDIKRTGILNTILLQDLYINHNKKNSSKNGRIYVRYNIVLNQEKYIISMSIASEELIKSSDGVIIEKMIKSLIKNLNNDLTLDFEKI